MISQCTGREINPGLSTVFTNILPNMVEDAGAQFASFFSIYSESGREIKNLKIDLKPPPDDEVVVEKDTMCSFQKHKFEKKKYISRDFSESCCLLSEVADKQQGQGAGNHCDSQAVPGH